MNHIARSKTASCLIFLYVISCIVTAKSCGDTQCQVLVQEVDSAFLFRSKATQEGVRLVHLNLEFSGQHSNDSYVLYKPLNPKNRILPYRWAWSQSVSEPMLTMPYDYDVLSLGLLTYQVRDIAVPLKDRPNGCLKELNSSCQDIAIARALLNLTRERNSIPSSEREDVVCVRVLHEYSFGVGGDFHYQCCGEDRQDNKSEILCNLSVKDSKLLIAFNKTLGVVFIVVLLYWPWFLCSSSNVVDEVDFDKRRIPIDDFSPITMAAIVKTFAEKLSASRHGDNIKMFFLWYCVIPIFFYIKVILYLLIKGNPFENASTKLLFQVINNYLYVFDLDRPLVYVLFIFPFFIIPGVIILCWRPKTLASGIQTKCRLCREKFFDPEQEILQHVRVLPQYINGWSKLFLNCCRCKLWRNSHDDSQHSACGHAFRVLWSVASVVIVGPIFAVIIILVYLCVSLACIIAFSPLVCLLMLGFRFIRQKSIPNGFLFAISKVILPAALVYSAVSVSLVLLFSSQFVVRTFGFIIMGLTLNADTAVPYVTFVFVVWRNIQLCYRNLQNKYKEVKKIISEQWKEVTKEELSTIPIVCFWKVCNDFEVLPVVYEFFLMLRNIVFIVVFLIVALTAILLFKVVHNSSVIMSSVAVFLSGKLSETFLIGVTADYSFIGWERICLEKKIARAIIKEYMKEPTEKIPRSLDICRLPTHFT
ncbi:uncharacterized protein [Montipora capricornis]|uniref:uncharacterized protein n=1 Tax=Montipora capricornis TaxID=246305 RepID=UPI0035F1840E